MKNGAPRAEPVIFCVADKNSFIKKPVPEYSDIV
jgi:hypothetical protein